MKTACVLRWGAWGDIIMATPVIRQLKKDGYHVTAYVSKKGIDVLKNNPFVDEILVHHDMEMTGEELGKLWNGLKEKYDRFINLSGSVEESLLIQPWHKEYNWTHEDRHNKCNINYYDHTLQWAGYPGITGKRGELYLDKKEERLVKKRFKAYKDKFVILWSMSGSSIHKAYPFTEEVADYLYRTYPDIFIITVGDEWCDLIEWENSRTLNASGKWSMRTSMLLTKYADLVIGTETGVLNAAGCFNTPKIILLSHSSEENLTKYWKNCIALHADIDCYPCHKMHYSIKTCKKEYITGGSRCMSQIRPETVIEAIEHFYKR